LSNDEPRLLARDSQHGYVSEGRRAMFPDAGEAVSEAERRELTSQANRLWSARQRAAWNETAKTITGASGAFEQGIAADARLVRDVRAVRRSTAAVGRRLAPR
jgi:hypothetical protein